MAQYGIRIGFCHCDRRNRFVAKIQYVAIAFLAQGIDLAYIYDIFSMTPYKRASFEALLYCFKTASENILLEVSFAVCIPYLDIVVV